MTVQTQVPGWAVDDVRRRMDARPQWAPPRVAGVVAATAVLSFLGVFAAVRAGKQADEQSTGRARYWVAFGATMLVKWTVMVAVSSAVTGG
ncbi:hypothetical protein [Actinoplanes solisilvae]|uniref:hypothetical protein n=1 Tax=Actinoplanes solisilvae TaxID=2486853 RepID=UPI000FDAE3AB|nr:hypothetical protein [Actinoplanes solisilvae]